jgi:y4mF family transcriptional regulator
MKSQGSHTLSGVAKSLGLQLKALREKAGLTQAALAKRTGVGLRFVREVEQGKATVRVDKVNQVLALFGYHLEPVKDNESAA